MAFPCLIPGFALVLIETSGQPPPFYAMDVIDGTRKDNSNDGEAFLLVKGVLTQTQSELFSIHGKQKGKVEDG